MRVPAPQKETWAKDGVCLQGRAGASQSFLEVTEVAFVEVFGSVHGADFEVLSPGLVFQRIGQERGQSHTSDDECLTKERQTKKAGECQGKSGGNMKARSIM